MSDENDNGRNSASGGRQPLTLKPRGGGSVSAGTVKQSFSHGRSKTVVVETKRPRTHAPAAGNLAAPSSAEKRMLDPRPAGTPAPQPRSPQGSADGRRKLIAQARKLAVPPRVFGLFAAAELGLALGGENVIHTAFLAGRAADRWAQDVHRLSGFCPLLPESWREEP